VFIFKRFYECFEHPFNLSSITLKFEYSIILNVAQITGS
jgi:hypothetical protein